MTKIIAFSLWGNNPKYVVGAIKNAQLAQSIYPGWTCRFYIGNDVSDNNKAKILDFSNSEIVEMGDTGWNGLFWRFFAADSDNIVISRDTDSRLNYREKAAVDEWLSSDADFHIMRDHPYHATAILGGMWGCRNSVLKGICQIISDYDKRDYNNKYQVDQNFLREIVYPIVRDRSITHDEFFTNLPFPNNATKRTSTYFVGQVYDENDKPIFS